MAIKRVLAGATEIKELITYEDETKASVGKGQAGQVLTTDGTNTYWGEGGGVNLEPIDIGVTILGWEENFGIDSWEITEEHYNQFIQNKYAPISLKYIDSTKKYIFTLCEFNDYGDNSAYCTYEYICFGYKHIICIEWYSSDEMGGHIDDAYNEPIGGYTEKPTKIHIKRITEPFEFNQRCINKKMFVAIDKNEGLQDRFNYIVKINGNKTFGIFNSNGIPSIYTNENSTAFLSYFGETETLTIYRIPDNYLNGLYEKIGEVQIHPNNDNTNVYLVDYRRLDYNYFVVDVDLNKNNYLSGELSNVTYSEITNYDYIKIEGLYDDIYTLNKRRDYIQIVDDDTEGVSFGLTYKSQDNDILFNYTFNFYVDNSYEFCCESVSLADEYTLICEMSNEDTQDTSNSYVEIAGPPIPDVVFDINKKYLLEISNESDIGFICFSEYVQFFGDNNSSRTAHKLGCHYESESDGPTPVILFAEFRGDEFAIRISSFLDKPLYGATVKIYQVN